MTELTISDIISINNINLGEGYTTQIKDQVSDLINLSSNAKNMMQIGFHAGHSAEILLENNKDLILTSFDICAYTYVIPLAEYINSKYSQRHSLILGDSRITVPLYNTNKFDIIFIDGGHEYNIVKADLLNCFKLATRDTIVIVDDIIFTENLKEHWTEGPTQAWIECCSNNLISEIERREYCKGRGMCWGKYNF
jgi:predicted O-methyltransferase YrrM